MIEAGFNARASCPEACFRRYATIMKSLTIGEVAQTAGITPETIRYYERLGVLEEAPRTTQGYRKYEARVLEELRLLKAAKDVGFSLEEIARMLALTREDPIHCRAMCEMVEHKITHLDARIRELQTARDRLASARAACDPNSACVVSEQLTFEPSPSSSPAPPAPSPAPLHRPVRAASARTARPG